MDGDGARGRLKAVRGHAASYLSRSWLSCSATFAFSRRLSLGPFLCSPFPQTPGEPRGAVGAAPPSPQPAMPRRRPASRALRSPRPAREREGGVSDRTLHSYPNPPPRVKGGRLPSVPRAAGPPCAGTWAGRRRRHVIRKCAQAHWLCF